MQTAVLQVNMHKSAPMYEESGLFLCKLLGFLHDKTRVKTISLY